MAHADVLPTCSPSTTRWYLTKKIPKGIEALLYRKHASFFHLCIYHLPPLSPSLSPTPGYYHQFKHLHYIVLKLFDFRVLNCNPKLNDWCNLNGHTSKMWQKFYLLSLGELLVDVLNGSSGILSENKACYHRPAGFIVLLEITKHMLLESQCLLIDTFS